MLHRDIYHFIKHQRQRDQFIHPFYESYSIAEIVPTILELFGIKTSRKPLDPTVFDYQPVENQKVILLIADGFGYNHVVNYRHQFPFLQRLEEKGDIYPLTSVFPSTTAAALTTLHTGLTPQEHGLPEWNVYFEEFDSIIETLPFRRWLEDPDSLVASGGKPEMLYDGQTAYQTLKEKGIPSFVFIAEQYVDTAYSRSVHKGSEVIGTKDGPDLIQKLGQKLARVKGPAYFSVYWGNIDSTAHKYGPDTDQHIAAIQEFNNFMEEGLKHISFDTARDCLFLMTADHGQINIRGQEIINLNNYPEIDKNLMVSKKGNRILPSGSPHDVFLFVDPDKEPTIVEHLHKALKDRAEILTVDDAVKLGLFGINQPTERFLKRIGNLLILPYPGHHVWYEFFPSIPYELLGIHGGLAEEEMLVPFAVIPLKDLLPV